MNDMTHASTDLAVTDDKLIDVLCSSLYPGAKRESAAMVLGYCRAAGLDPMLKPVHIVPMRVKTGQKNRYGGDEYAMKDTVMPGIGLYRVQAARTGEYAGMDEPVFGPMQEMPYQQVKRTWVDKAGSDKKQPVDIVTDKAISYPEWCQVTVYRLVNGFRMPFPAREYWLENYATASADSDAPNSMWAKRVMGQIIKCAEAQALRKAFPEVGAQPIAEEFEGRGYDADAAPAEPETVEAVKTKPRRASEAAATPAPAPAVNVDTPPPPAAPALTDQTAAQQEAAALVGAAITPAQEKVLADAAAPAPAAPAPAPAAAAPAPAAAPAEPKPEPATDGEKRNVLITAKAKGADLAGLLTTLGFALDATTLDGMTKAQFKALKAKLS